MSHDPFDYPISRYLLFAAIGVMGGLVARLQYWAGGEQPHCLKCALFRLLADLLTSAFCGILIFWISAHFELSGVIAAALAGICGHMGSRSLFLLERLISNKLARYALIKSYPLDEPAPDQQEPEQKH